MDGQRTDGVLNKLKSKPSAGPDGYSSVLLRR